MFRIVMVKRLLALWLILPPAAQVSAWVGLTSEHACSHEFCTCRDHCARRPAARMPCHEVATAPAPHGSMNDACHEDEAAALLAVSTYLLPDVVDVSLLDDAVVSSVDHVRDPLFGFERLELPPPRSTAS